MKYLFKKTDTVNDFQKFISDVYSLPDDRLYSIWDLLTQQQRFCMRALKGIRKGNILKLKSNLLITFSFLMATANRLHINVETELWKRFPYLCSYCGKKPCACKSIHPKSRIKAKVNNNLKPLDLEKFQKMFDEIYPSKNRTLADAGVHLAEEMGEVSESIHNYLGEHHLNEFEEIKLEISDFISCIFGVANSANINVSRELQKMYCNNCHVCHQAPCVCKFSEVVHIKS